MTMTKMSMKQFDEYLRENIKKMNYSKKKVQSYYIAGFIDGFLEADIIDQETRDEMFFIYGPPDWI